MRRVGISKSRINLGVSTTRAVRNFSLYFVEPRFELQLLRLQFCSQDRGDFLVKRPKFLYRLAIQIDAFHSQALECDSQFDSNRARKKGRPAQLTQTKTSAPLRVAIWGLQLVRLVALGRGCLRQPVTFGSRGQVHIYNAGESNRSDRLGVRTSIARSRSDHQSCSFGKLCCLVRYR